MGWISGTVVYLLIWWVVLFTVLPWNNNPPETPGLGHATSAPKAPNLKVKFLATTGIAGIIWVAVYVLIEIKVIDYRAIAIEMMQEDKAQ